MGDNNTSQTRFGHVANQLLKTVDFSLEDIREWAILDSGATSHFLVVDAPADDVMTATNPISVRQPDGAKVQSSHTCELRIPQLPKKARLAHVIPGLASHSLMSVVRLCNCGCEVTFTKIDCVVRYRGKIILRGYKDNSTGLWMVNLKGEKSAGNIANAFVPAIYQIAEHIPKPPPEYELQDSIQTAANALEVMMSTTGTKEMIFNLIKTSNPVELAMFYHQVLCSPPKSTLMKAIKNGQLRTFPGLTYELIRDYLPESTATDKGHMIRKRSGVQSTRNQRQEILDARKQVDDMNPPQEAFTAIDDEMFCFAMLADKNEGTVYSDLAGKFPVQSYEGHLYLFVCYVYSKNAIIMRTMTSRSDESMVETFKSVYEFLKKYNCSPKLHVLDNECSKAVQNFVEKENTNIQLVKPRNHRVNAAETAIKSAKYHIIAGLQTIDPDCPLQLWSKFTSQMQDTLNLLRTAREDPRKLAYEALQGAFDYNKTPMAVLGTKALAFTDP